VPLAYDVHQIDVFVALSGAARVPKKSLGTVKNDLFQKRERKRFDKLVQRADAVAEKALEYWLRLLRWRTGNWMIGQRQVSGLESGWATYLADAASEMRFYSGPVDFSVGGRRPISKRVWNSAQESLSAQAEPPVWYQFLFDGEPRLGVDDLHGSVLSLAIACESLLRALFSKHVGAPRDAEFLRLINLVPVMRLLERWRQLGFRSKAWERSMDRKAIKSLFECRNRIMHRGSTQELTRAECERYARAARPFVLHGDQTAAGLGVV